MRRILLAGLVLPLLIAPAFSQTAAQPGGANATPPSSAPGGKPAPAGTSAMTPPAATGSTAMPTPTPAPTAMTPAPMPAPTAMTPTATTTTGTAATLPTGGAPGANSFTEGQAKTRLEDKGYTAVSGLKKDADGIWRGTAMMGSKSVSVSVDYKGDITGG